MGLSSQRGRCAVIRDTPQSSTWPARWPAPTSAAHSLCRVSQMPLDKQKDNGCELQREMDSYT